MRLVICDPNALGSTYCSHGECDGRLRSANTGCAVCGYQIAREMRGGSVLVVNPSEVEHPAVLEALDSRGQQMLGAAIEALLGRKTRLPADRRELWYRGT